jgi:hypothetical protein
MKPSPHTIEFSAILIILFCVSVFAPACALSINLPPKISSLKADTMYVYPTGIVEVQCSASDPESDAMTFKWSSTDGTFTGTGSAVTWRAPNAYGKFHIMVIVEDSKGSSSKETLTIEVVENQEQGCNTCNGR